MSNKEKYSEVVERSHQRSIEYGIQKEQIVSKKILSHEAANENIRKNDELIRNAIPLMKDLYDFLAGSGFILVLTDREGCILSIFGDESTLNAAEELNMVIGAYMDEKSIGTNAMGTAISENAPVQISAKEHFITAFHRWTCSAAPIHNVAEEIIGTLNLTGASSLVHPHTLGSVATAVRSIEFQIKNEAVQSKLLEANQYNNTIMNTISQGIVAVDFLGKINMVNNNFCSILKLTREALINEPIGNFVEEWNKISEYVLNGNNYQDEEVNLLIAGHKEKYLLNANPIYSDKNNIIGMVLTFKEIQKIINLVNKYTGMRARYTFEDIIGESEEIKKLIKYAKQAADSSATILIEGESGTGKEVMAQAIHNYSARRDNGFVAINCGAIHKNLIESELFGYDEGAFTGAKKGGQPGKFELASEGTLFLDEIGEMPLELQVSLLRVLQEGYIMRVGGNKYIPVNVRIIAASNKDLKKEVEKGNFRQDLYYRISVIPIHIPSLRERKEDIRLLANHFIKMKALKLGRENFDLDEDVMGWICQNEWIGNIRELENFIEKCLILDDRSLDDGLAIDTISECMIQQKAAAHGSIEEYEGLFICSLEELEKKSISILLKKFDNNISKVAKILDIGRNTLYLKMKKYKLNNN